MSQKRITNFSKSAFSTSWSREKSSGFFSHLNNCFNGRKEKIFCILSWLAMKNRYTTITLSVENLGVSPAMHQHRRQSRISMVPSYWFPPAGSSLLWAAQTKRNYHRRSLSTTLDAFEPSIEGKTAAIRAERDTTKSFRNMTTKGHILQNQWKPTWKCSNGMS